jgi:toxin ParE1/3/4
VATRFRNEFRAACAILAEHPGIGSHRYAHLLEGAELRTWSLDRFPFLLFYIVKGDVLRVLAVEHERRNITRRLLRAVK